LFRSNSTCTRFLSAFAKVHGYAYLRSLIIPLIKSMVTNWIPTSLTSAKQKLFKISCTEYVNFDVTGDVQKVDSQE